MRNTRWYVLALLGLLVASMAFGSPLQRQSQLVASSDRHGDLGPVLYSVDPSTSQDRGTKDRDTTYVICNWDDDPYIAGDWTEENYCMSDSLWWQINDVNPLSGSYSWRIGDGTEYANHILQFIWTQSFDLTGTTAPQVSAIVGVECETAGGDPPWDSWDGGNMWVRYNDGGTWVEEILLPTTNSYDVASLFCFGGEFVMGPNIPGWSGSAGIAAGAATVADLTPYNSYSEVQVGFAFCADPLTVDGYGMVVDDISVDDGETNILFIDAEDQNEATMTKIGGWDPGVSGVFTIANDVATDADGNSPGHAASVIPGNDGFSLIFRSPAFTMLDADPSAGESLIFTMKVWADMVDADVDPSFSLMVYDPALKEWNSYENSYVGPWGAEEAWSDIYNRNPDAYDLTYLQGVEGVRLGVQFELPDLSQFEGMGLALGDYDFVYFDRFEITRDILRHDIESLFIVPFPTTVGYPIVPVGIFNNLSLTQGETGVVCVWEINEVARPFSPAPPYEIAFEGSITLEGIDPTDVPYGFGWIPDATSSAAAPTSVVAKHTLTTDQNTDNDQYGHDLWVEDVGFYELGYDARFHDASAAGQGLSGAVRIDPSDFTWFDSDTDLTIKGFVGNYYLPQGIPTFTWTIYEDDDGEMGSEVWNTGEVTGTQDPDQQTNFQTFVYYLDGTDLPTVPCEPFWVVAEITGGLMLCQESWILTPEDCPFYYMDEGEWVSNYPYDIVLRVIVDGNIMPYLTTGVEPEDGDEMDLDDDPEVTFSWTGGSPDGETMSYTLYLEDTGGNTLDYTTTSTSQVVDFIDEGYYSGEWTWYVVGTEASGLTSESDEYSLTVTSDVGESASLPKEFALENAYPNPFNPSTTLRYQVPRAGHVQMVVYNLMGQEVARLVNQQVQPGTYAATFDASALSSGLYFIRMQADGFNAVQKVMLMK
jgi:hypothetical protein